jgi:hypothetical protein
VPSQDRGLLARLDALVELAADRHGLALLPGGRLAAAEARVAARAAGLTSPTRGPTSRGPTARGSALALRDAVELLRAVGEGVGLLRVRGDRLEATSLRHAWAQIDPGLRAGLVYAAWCQQVTFTAPDSSRFVSVFSLIPGPAASAIQQVRGDRRHRPDVSTEGPCCSRTALITAAAAAL